MTSSAFGLVLQNLGKARRRFTDSFVSQDADRRWLRIGECINRVDQRIGRMILHEA